MRKRTIWIRLFAVLALLPGIVIFAGDSDSAGWWIFNYGDYTQTNGKNDPRIRFAARVFEQVKNAADKAASRPPRLFIINTRSGPYVQALPDGGIIINPLTLDICYGGDKTSKEEGDCRLAFILGHELAHLANEDFLHREAFMTLLDYKEKRGQNNDNPALGKLEKYFQSSKPEKAREYKRKELLADTKGVLYAAAAGYDMNNLFEQDENFLSYWAKQAGIGSLYDEDQRHPSINSRVNFIRAQLAGVIDKVELFRAGVLLFQVESYHDSAAAFLEFAKVYPAREVFNNIGACYLALAMRHLYMRFDAEYYRFRLSTTVDYATGAELLHARGEGDYLKDKLISGYLDRSENYFEQAAARDKYDAACRYNLSAVSILKKEYARAHEECNVLLKINPGDIKALNNKAVAFYYYGRVEDIDTTQKAIQMLEKAHRADPGNADVLYNLASLKQLRDRLAGSKAEWEKYLVLPFAPRDNYYQYINHRLHGTTVTSSSKPVEIPPRPAGIGIGQDCSRIEKKWGKENTRNFVCGTGLAGEEKDGWAIEFQVSIKENIRLIAIDGTVEIIEQELSAAQEIALLLEKFGPPSRVVHHTSGNFYVYQDRGFSLKEVSGKLVSYIWFEKGF